MKNKVRRPYATISVYGVSFLRHQNPYMVAWWSASFPGFGHYLLNQYIRGTLLTLAEVGINSVTNINLAIIYSFCGKFEMAKSVLQPRWVIVYVLLYFLIIWDSYRSALIQNKLSHLAQLENERLAAVNFRPLELQYIEPKKPWVAVVYSLLFPGLGQLYNHQFALAFYAMTWWWIYVTLSHAHESLILLLLGNVQESITVIQPSWLLFMPSVLGGSVYYAFITARELNRLFRTEQRQFLAERYRKSDVRVFPE
ncbi:hypothetical protein GTO89_04635 [Heliobacterium gestii]|uniref:Uncharacterized protein n=1 Tax=Heliomicrobium gestii TaxID=2699 RepID=A0A845L6M6_HELGE|nr:hypothetical protein [Heliomicrobium gestii]MBM7866900.1 TM2 domain-containing membrane protein YozV [Heliomicrobium gestii]MZP42327.1 hypothetical protein [Heliomicrobium gestii]